MKRVIVAATFSIFAIPIAIVMVQAASAFAANGAPPAELVQLEREVSLKMAHARDLGSIQPEKMKRLADAQAFDAKGEAALRAGDYSTAETDFLKAKVLLRDLDK